MPLKICFRLTAARCIFLRVIYVVKHNSGQTVGIFGWHAGTALRFVVDDDRITEVEVGEF